MKKKISKLLSEFLRAQKVVPFETVIAFFCIYGGIAAILGIGMSNDLFRTVLGRSLSLIFDIAYILSGLAMYFGIGLKRRDVEAFGLVTVATSLLIRIISISWIAGISSSVFNLYVINLSFMAACAVRLFSLLRNKVIIEGTIKDGKFIND